MTQEEWDKFIHGSEKDKFDKEVSKLYHNAQSTESKTIIAFMHNMINDLLKKLEIERKENEHTTRN